ncbi:MAG: aminoglycoside 6-adenylyltransferase, partial [Lachnospiraceae bacterium]|nr:aminoglycoside 6-adenylyltransferase [Lachnospiraceae bacterium]
KHHVDVWHNGRFLERWAEKEVLMDLEKCFAHYDKDDMVSALFSTEDLFGKLASQTAEMKGYKYPKEAENYAKLLLSGYMDKIKG